MVERGPSRAGLLWLLLLSMVTPSWAFVEIPGIDRKRQESLEELVPPLVVFRVYNF